MKESTCKVLSGVAWFGLSIGLYNSFSFWTYVWVGSAIMIVLCNAYMFVGILIEKAKDDEAAEPPKTKLRCPHCGYIEV